MRMQPTPSLPFLLFVLVPAVALAQGKGGAPSGSHDHDHGHDHEHGEKRAKPPSLINLPFPGPAEQDPALGGKHSHGDGHGHAHEGDEPSAHEKAAKKGASLFDAKSLAKFEAYERERLLGDPSLAAKRSKLSDQQADQMGLFARRYYLSRQGVARHRAELAELQAKLIRYRSENSPLNKPDLEREQMLKLWLEQGEEWSAQYGELYGKEQVALLATRESAFVALLDEADKLNNAHNEEARAAAAAGLDAGRLENFLTFQRTRVPLAGPAREAALKKAELTEQQRRGILLFANEYYEKRGQMRTAAAALAEAKANLEKKRAAGERTQAAELYVEYFADQVGEWERYRAGLAEKYGPTLPELFDSFEQRFQETFAPVQPKSR